MAKIKITESEFRKIIREEGEKIKKEMILRTHLEKIDSELAQLKEVHAGGNMAPGTDGVHAGQKKAVFDKKGTHLVEDQEDLDMDTEEMPSTDMGAEEMPSVDMGAEEMSSDDMSPDMGTISIDKVMAAIKNLGNQLDLTGSVEFDGGVDASEMGSEDMGSEMGSEEISADGDGEMELDVDVQNDTEDAGVEDMPASEEKEEEESVVDECADDMAQESNNPLNESISKETLRMKFLAGIK